MTTVRPSRVGPAGDGADERGDPLPAAVAAALAVLRDLNRALATHRRIEVTLRAALEAHARTAARATTSGPALPAQVAAAVTTACAHLGAGQLEDACLALLTARDTIAGHRRQSC